MISQKRLDIFNILCYVVQQANIFKCACVKIVQNSVFKNFQLSTIQNSDFQELIKNLYLLFQILGLLLYQCIYPYHVTNSENHQAENSILRWLAFAALTTSAYNTYLTTNKCRILEVYLNNLVISSSKKHLSHTRYLNETLNLLTVVASILSGVFIAPFLCWGFIGLIPAEIL